MPDLVRARFALVATMAWSATALLLSLAVLLGLWVGAWLAPPPVALALVVAAGLLVAALCRRRRRAWLPALLVVALAVGLWRYEATRLPAGPAGIAYYIGRDVTLTGTVDAAPELLDHGETIRLAVASATLGRITRPVVGDVLAHLGGYTALAYGDRIALAGRLAAPPQLPGGSPDGYRAYLAAQGIYAVLSYPRLQHLGSGAGNPLLALVIALRAWLEGGIKHSLPEPAATLLIGILLGTRTRALGVLTQPFVNTGMIHLLAIDGLKVTLVVGTVDALARRLAGQRRALVVTLPALLLYILVTGATPAGLRAGLMWTLTLLALRFGRRSDAVTSLGLAAALLGFISPRILWDLGFQLSLAGTAGIVLLSPGLQRWLARLPGPLRESTAMTLAAQIGTLPLLATGFGQLSLAAPVANTLLLPLLGPIMALGLPAALAGALLAPLGQLLGLFVYPLLEIMIVAVRALASVPFAAVPLAALPSALMIGYYALVALAALGPLHGAPSPAAQPARPAPAWRLPALGGLGVLLFVAVVAWQAPRHLYTLALKNLGVGQAMALTTPGGQAVLIDGGDSPSLLAAALGNRLPFGQARLDLVVANDVDAAHVAGLRGLSAYYAVGRALDPGAVYPSAAYALWRAELRDAGVPEAKLRTGVHQLIDASSRLDVLQPDGLDPAVPLAPVVLRLSLGQTAMLLLNRAALDAGPATWHAQTERHDAVLVLPAGARDPSAAAALVRLIRPRLVVLPSTDDARDDPTADAAVFTAARAIGARTWQGGDGGSLTLTVDGTRLLCAGLSAC